MTTGKTIALTRWTFVSKVMSLLFNTLSRFVLAFLSRSKHLLISWLQSPLVVILEPPKNKLFHCFHCCPIYLSWIKLPYDPIILLLGIYPEQTIIEKDTCTPMFIAVLFTIARTWKQRRRPSIDEWTKTFTEVGYSAGTLSHSVVSYSLWPRGL